MKRSRGPTSYDTGRRSPVAAMFSRNDYLMAALTAVMTLVIYVPMLPPTITGEDSGELIAAAYTLGIPHPPGYPLWCMLGKLFTIILPFNSIAWRVAAMSTALAAAATFLLTLIVIKLTRNRLAAVIAGLALAVSADFWAQSLIAEVYSLNALIILACVFILLVWQERRDNRLLYIFAFVYGLGLCNHQTIHLLGPVFALFILSLQPRPWTHWRSHVAMLAIAFGTWLVIHLYLPIRSLANPPMDWGNPETWDSFWYTVLRKQYELGFVQKPITFAGFIGQLAIFGQMHARQWTPYLMVLPLLGLYPLWKTSRRRFAFICGTFCYIVIGFILVLNFAPDSESCWINSTFFIAAHLFSAILIGAAVAWLAKPRRLPIALAVSAAVILVPLLSHYRNNDKSNYYFTHDYAINLLKTLDTDAIYFPTADHTVFSLMYFQDVEGVRPDVLIGNRYGYEEAVLYKDMPAQIKNQISTPPDDQDGPVIQDWTVAHSNRPVFFGRKRKFENAPEFKMITAGLLFKAVPQDQPPSDLDYWSLYEWHTLDPAHTRGDFTARNIIFDYHYARARCLLERGNIDEGFDELMQADALAGDTKEKLNNLAGTCAEYERYDMAREYYQKTIDMDPDYRVGLRNLAVLHGMLGDYQEGISAMLRVIEIDGDFYGPDSPIVADGLNDMAIMLYLSGKKEQAADAFKKAQTIDFAFYGAVHPAYARDTFNLGLALHAVGDQQEAQAYRQQALEFFQQNFGPNHPHTQAAQKNHFIQSQ